jgi:putative hydrolase of the HAD superfamily
VVRAVTLDLWGTLFIDGPGSDDRYRRPRLAGMRAALAGAGIGVTLDELERGYAATGAWLARLWQVNRDVPVREHVQVLLAAVDPALPGRLLPETMAAVIDAYATPALVAPPAIDPGAAAALAALAIQGTRLALVSNTMRTPGEVLNQILERAGLRSLFDAVTFSDECRVRKPDAAIFHRTLALLGVPAHEAAHVGDDPILDVEGPRDAGMLAIQLTPGGLATAPVKPHAVIRQLRELPATVRRLG